MTADGSTRKLVVYSSRTGNTRRIAEAGAAAWGAGTTLAAVADAPDPDAFDRIAVGFWIDKGRPDAAARKFIKRLRGKDVAFFFTLGADPDSDHARACAADAEARLAGNRIVGHFYCQGRVDPALVRRLEKWPSWFPHGPNAERRARWARAEPHPDADDETRARAAFQGWLNV